MRRRRAGWSRCAAVAPARAGGPPAARFPRQRSAPPTTARGPIWIAACAGPARRSWRSRAARSPALRLRSVERPGASVWISTSGGANSGKTSSGVSCAAREPTTSSTTASATTTRRSRRACSTIQRIMSGPLLSRAELDAEQLGGAIGHDPRSLRRGPATAPRRIR